ncbi:hypothetical protein BDV38DRAFT_234231 [Aspergillus pseudotamarii]|uniref:Uncharacterized protein n=1 Tax=Aspergillus pseudotamarii TaxID=132259 RepID=A0A5N6T971_ASPPS|nr:uncharacterized protein BDV38DRAFT_234231 [Aspergillus pseudotamarii]KAE8142895.1 hypothetical protein BDV38DRAFT_234231 [Aspergillus pseudotamarii]
MKDPIGSEKTSNTALFAAIPANTPPGQLTAPPQRENKPYPAKPYMNSDARVTTG